MNEVSDDSADQELLTQDQVDQQQAAIFEKYLGGLQKSIYLTALEILPNFRFLRDVVIEIDPNSSQLRGGTIDGRPNMHIGTREGTVTPGMRSRIMERFQLPKELSQLEPEMFDEIVKAIAFAHELAHVVQDDPAFSNVYGQIDPTDYDAGKDYELYVNSDREANADFIAAEIVSRSELGIGLESPEEKPSDWRLWAKKHSLGPQAANM